MGKRQNVQDFFSTNVDQDIYEFNINIKTIRACPNTKINVLEFFSDVSEDLFRTFGDIDMDVTINVHVQRDGLIPFKINILGHAIDLYDFDREVLNDLNLAGVNLQAGFNTLGPEGHIFRSKVEFKESIVDLFDTFSYQ